MKEPLTGYHFEGTSLALDATGASQTGSEERETDSTRKTVPEFIWRKTNVVYVVWSFPV